MKEKFCKICGQEPLRNSLYCSQECKRSAIIMSRIKHQQKERKGKICINCDGDLPAYKKRFCCKQCQKDYYNK